MVALEPILAKAGGRAAAYVGRKALDKLQRKALVAQLRPLIARDVFTRFVDSLTPAQATRFDAFIASPQFEHLALQAMTWQLTGRPESIYTELRHGVNLSLRRRVELKAEKLTIGTDLVVQLLTVATDVAMPSLTSALAGPHTLAVAADIAAASARNNELLGRLRSLKAIDQFGSSLRTQVHVTKSKMRLTHLGNRSAVEYAALHVDPRFHRRTVDAPPCSIGEVLEDRQRVIVLGDPGAGKSTFAAKLAHDLAADGVPGMEGRVPFLLIARELITAMSNQRQPLADLMASVAAAPYNVKAPPDAVEYLLLNGLAFVIIDGVDEFGDAEARRRLGELIEGFAHLYPTVNVVVTSREIGYSDAPLDTDLFTDFRIAPFDDDQIGGYTANWFGLDSQLSAAGQAELAESFLRESADITDLRSNPLMLSLLCSLYSSKHYIPHHRTEIYEQCAEMLFEQWDRHRGITVPLRFASHMRPAVARLAWMMFTEENGQPVSRDRISDFLIDYMMEEQFDKRADAVEAVEEFLDFCAGRAWVLTKVGTATNRPVYGFTHRTFLEYFTAVQLLRMGPSVEEVWNQLEPRIADSSWQVVANLSVQLLHRGADGGGSLFVDRLVKAAASASDRAAYLTFAAQIAGQIALRTPVLRALALECVRLAGEVSVEERHRFYWRPDDFWDVDSPLERLLKVDLPENAPRIVTAIVGCFSDSSIDLTDDEHSYGILLGYLYWTKSYMRGLRAEVDAAPISAEERRWIDHLLERTPDDIRRLGVGVLFKGTRFRLATKFSVAGGTLRAALGSESMPWVEDYRGVSHGSLDAAYEPIVEEPWPWLRARLGPTETVTWLPRVEGDYLIPQLRYQRFLQLDSTQRSTALLLLLPLLQDAVVDVENAPPGAEPFVALLAARKAGSKRAAAIVQIEEWALRKRAHDLVVSWVNDEASPVLRYE